MSEEVEYYFVTDYQLDRLKRILAMLTSLATQSGAICVGDLVHLRETIHAIGFQTRELLDLED